MKMLMKMLMQMLMQMLLTVFIALTVITGVLFIVGQFLPPTEWGPLFWPFGLFVPVGVVGSLVSFGILYFVWGWVPWRDRDKRAGKVSFLNDLLIAFVLGVLVLVALSYLFFIAPA